MSQAEKNNIICKELELTMEELVNADEIFMTNSLMPVRSIEQLKVDGVMHSKAAGTMAEWAFSSVLESIQSQVQRNNL
jgi:4-amino-4-deoxychorismate lyase